MRLGFPRCLQGARNFSLFLLVTFIGIEVTAATFYVDAATVNDSGKGSELSPKKFISSGIRLLSRNGGDTLILRNGRYDHAQDAISRNTVLFNGASANPNLIKAETDGGVTVSAGLDLPLASAFLSFEGIKWDGPASKSIAGREIKFLRCAFKNGARTGNSSTLVIGTNDQQPGASRILLEDSWIYGQGGRYRLLVYNAEKVVLRRVVVRHDGGWEYDGRNPQGGVSIYNTQNVELQNILLIDNDLELPGWEAALYLVRNPGKGTFDRHAGTRIRGSMIVNTRQRAVGVEGWGRVEDATFENLLVWKAGQGLSLNNEAHQVKVKQATFALINGPAFAIWGKRPSSLEVNQTLVHDALVAFQVDAGTIEGAFNACSRTRKCITRHSVSVEALAAGLKYPPRVEKGSRLRSAARAGTPIGATIESAIGRSGSMYGDDGFDSSGAAPLWPWPLENRIKRDLCEGQQTRGFCAGNMTISSYVWGQLGNGPGGTYATQ